jgi:hypothetical protein
MLEDTEEFKFCWQTDCRHCDTSTNEIEPTCLLPRIQCDTLGKCASVEPRKAGVPLKMWNEPDKKVVVRRWKGFKH